MASLKVRSEPDCVWALYRFNTAQALDRALAVHVSRTLRLALEARAEAALALSGGRTPVAMLDLLAQQALDWGRVWVTLADERWLAPEHEESNAALVRRMLLHEHASRAHFIPLWNSAPTPSAGQMQTEQALKVLPERFDLVLLGMGEDGHTASLFAGAPELLHALAPLDDAACCAITPVQAPWPRLTLTLPRLLAAREIVLQLTGAEKWAMLQRALGPGPVEELPVRALFRQRQTPVRIYWAP